MKSSHYNKNIVLVRDWYTKQHGNWTGLNGERSKWKIWDNACSIALTSALQIQQYVSNIVVGKIHAYMTVPSKTGHMAYINKKIYGD